MIQISRTSIYKIMYPLILIFLIVGIAFLVKYYHFSRLHTFMIIIALLIPGRIAGYFYRDFFRGLKLFHKHEWEMSEDYFNKFEQQLVERPWIKKLIWLLWGMYTWKIEAMTQNNLGAIKISTGYLIEAESRFNTAIELDYLYPKPFYNLAVIEYLKGNQKKSLEYFSQSVSLGYKGSTYDQLIDEGQRILAQFEGSFK
ncbi:MAG: hypothetical protein IEMM0008_0540 [bacterium]|nr:MAG: hypothetical protein IEMM0008_0540 [bacterium]